MINFIAEEYIEVILQKNNLEDYDKIKNLEYLPNNLQKLIVNYNYITELELLPSSIIELYCSGYKINKINIFPSLQKLICGPYFNNLNEAVTEELAKRFTLEMQNHQLFAEEAR